MSYYKQALWIFIFLSVLTMIIIYLKMIVIYHPHEARIDKYTRFMEKLSNLVTKKEYVKNEFIKTADNFMLDTIYLVNPSSSYCIILFHGNAGNISMRYDIIKFLYNYASVFVFDYRAYGRSSGDDIDLNCQALQIDSIAVWNHVINKLEYKANQISLIGESLGCSMAVYIAAEVSKTHNADNYPHSIVLNSPFYSLESMTVSIFSKIGFDIIGYILSMAMSNEYRTAEWINYINYQTKIIIAHSPRDEVIPYNEAVKLFTEVKNNHQYISHVRFITVSGTHNNLGLTDEYIYALADLFNE